MDIDSTECLRDFAKQLLTSILEIPADILEFENCAEVRAGLGMECMLGCLPLTQHAVSMCDVCHANS